MDGIDMVGQGRLSKNGAIIDQMTGIEREADIIDI
jgi:hypothetical protein